MKMRLVKFARKKITKDQSGFTLVEVLVSIALLGVLVAGLALGLSTTLNVLLRNDVRETAKNLAETQMEFVKKQAFSPGSGTSVYTSAPIPAAQSAYAVSINVIDGANLTPARDGYLQEIIITVTGPKNIIHLSLTGYKVQ